MGTPELGAWAALSWEPGRAERLEQGLGLEPRPEGRLLGLGVQVLLWLGKRTGLQVLLWLGKRLRLVVRCELVDLLFLNGVNTVTEQALYSHDYCHNVELFNTAGEQTLCSHDYCHNVPWRWVLELGRRGSLVKCRHGFKSQCLWL